MNEIPGEQLPLKPPQLWHSNIRELTGNFLDDDRNVFETATFRTRNQYVGEFRFSILSITGKGSLAELDLTEGIYIVTTIPIELFTYYGNSVLHKLENLIMTTLTKDSEPVTQMPLTDLPIIAESNSPSTKKMLKEKGFILDLGNTMRITFSKAVITTGGDKQNLLFFEVAPALLKDVTDRLSSFGS